MFYYLSDQLILLLLIQLVFITSAVESYVVNAVVEKPKLITCWTCPNKTDQSYCKKWAYMSCPDNYTICQTIHRINVRTGETISVNKRCALLSECSMDMIGCHDTHIPGVQDCISCCNWAYCNDMVPHNSSTAFLYSSISNTASTLTGSDVRWATILSLLSSWILFHFRFVFLPLQKKAFCLLH